jgi:type II secretory pathway component PulF
MGEGGVIEGKDVEKKRPVRRFLKQWFLSIACGLAFLILGFIMAVVVPKFAQMFREMGFEEYDLPRSTATLIRSSRSFCRFWFLYVPAFLGLSFLVSRVPQRWHKFLEPVVIIMLGCIVLFIWAALFAPRIPGGLWQLE